MIFDIENWLWKYDFGTFWRTIIHRRIVLKLFSFEHVDKQKSCILGPTIYKIPQLNWHYSKHNEVFFHQQFQKISGKKIISWVSYLRVGSDNEFRVLLFNQILSCWFIFRLSNQFHWFENLWPFLKTISKCIVWSCDRHITTIIQMRV